MIEKTIGRVRKLIKHREAVIKILKSIPQGDKIIFISIKENHLTTAGYVDNSADSLSMLGLTLGQVALEAKKANPDLNLSEFLHQPVSVALAYLQKEGAV